MPQAAAVTQIAAMPILVIAVARSGVRSRLVRWTMLGLAFSWLGDTVPRFLSGDVAFLAMVGEFLLAQVAYIVAFAPLWRGSVLRVKPIALVAYGGLFVALAAACLPEAGWLAPAVIVYGLVLMTMAVLATGVNRLAGLGGALFFVSDGLIALRQFADWWPLTGAGAAITIMTTYFGAQVLLVLGVLRRERAVVSDPVATPVGR